MGERRAACLAALTPSEPRLPSLTCAVMAYAKYVSYHFPSTLRAHQSSSETGNVPGTVRRFYGCALCTNSSGVR